LLTQYTVAICTKIMYVPNSTGEHRARSMRVELMRHSLS
jgi:hypothetical protein